VREIGDVEGSAGGEGESAGEGVGFRLMVL